MSKTRYRWWGYIKAVIRAYPEHKRNLADIKEQNIIANYSGYSGHSGASKPIEALALRQLPKNEQKEFDAVDNALEVTAKMPDGADRIKLLNMVFWAQTHTLQGAADCLYISYGTAKRWHNRFIVLVAKFYGFLD